MAMAADAMPSRRERLAQFAATATPAKAIRRASLGLARAPVALSVLWATIEGTGDVLSVVIGKLEAPRDIGNAAAVSRVWRATAANDDAWESACRSFPLLCLVRAQNWCVNQSFKALLAQQHAADYMMQQAPERWPVCTRTVCGPRLLEDHFSVRSLKGSNGFIPIPAGSARATRAQVEHNSVLRRLTTTLNGKICLLSDGEALFPSGTAPLQPPRWEVAEVTKRTSVLGLFASPWREDSSWFESLLVDAKDMSGMMHVSEVVARRGPSEFLREMINSDLASLNETAAKLRAIADGQELATTKAAALAALNICIDITYRKQKDIPRRPHCAGVFKADLHHFAQSNTRVEGLRKPIEHQLLFTDTPESKLCVLETSTIRRNFLLGIEVRSGCGTVLFSKLAELNHLRPGLTAPVLYASTQSASWPGPANVPPRVSVFMLRKTDAGRLDLVVDSDSSHAHEEEYEYTFENSFGIEGTGRYGGLFNLLRLQVFCTRRAGSLSRVSVRLEFDVEHYNDWVVHSVEWMLHIVSSPAFVRRWVAPPRKRRARVQAGASRRAPGHAHELLRTAVASAKPAPLMSLVLKHLEVKPMVRTGVVSRGWYAAVNHPETWSRALQMHPLLAQIRKHSDIIPSSSAKSLFIQQHKARCAMSAELVRPPRTDYCLAVEIHEDGKLVHASLADITVANPKTDLLAEVYERLATVTFLQGETVMVDSDVRLSFSMFRKHDGKRFPLFNGSVQDGDAGVLYFYGKLPDVFTIYDNSQNESSVPVIRFDVDLYEEPHSDDSSATVNLKSLNINIDCAGDEEFNSMCSVDGMIQLLNCPGFVHLWK